MEHESAVLDKYDEKIIKAKRLAEALREVSHLEHEIFSEHGSVKLTMADLSQTATRLGVLQEDFRELSFQ